MNISNPVSAAIDRVEFDFLTSKDVRSISVKRIQNDSTFDSLLNPVPGGLYDQALGAWGDSPCLTCHLNQYQCPGHAGHVELPCPVYHPTFIDQVLTLLRAQCRYCSGFRMSPRLLHKYLCKFQLLQYGLLKEAHHIDTLDEDLSYLPDDLRHIDSESEAEEEGATSSQDPIIRKRNRFVAAAIKGRRLSVSDAMNAKHEGASALRRVLVKEFLVEANKVRKCAVCHGVSPRYRKDGATKIFEWSLSNKDSSNMKARRLKAVDAMTTSSRPSKMTKAEQKKEQEQQQQQLMDQDSQVHESETQSDSEDVDMEDAPVDSKPVQRYLSAMEVQSRLELLFDKEQAILALLYNSRPSSTPATISPDMFFIEAILVPPNRFRPEARMGAGQVSENEQNALFKNILRSCERIQRAGQMAQDNTRTARHLADLHRAWVELQGAVNSLIDKNLNPTKGAAALKNEEGIKQKLEKKEGLFRMNMMGKRVNYAARSVISPDPNIETNEIGVPLVFATRLTYPEPVTSHNFRELQQAVINGASQWPGAVAIESETGQLTNLRWKTPDQRAALANQLMAPSSLSATGTKNKKVHRHITNGDVVLMNRQPTLHKPSIMGHRVRVLPAEKTIRMHYANCNTYNADFDGDEMNMHFPQNEIARAEALQIADTDHQYISGTQGKPLRGLIQDHLSISVSLCSKDTFFGRGDYQQLVYAALRPEHGHILGERLELVPPAVIKPFPRWTGKQVVTTILKNIRPPNCGGLWMTGKTQLKPAQWGVGGDDEALVRFIDGEFVSGILDKSQLGPSSGGMIHAIHEVYGAAIAGKTLSAFGRLLTRLLHMRAFSCGMDDLRLTAEGDAARTEILSTAQSVGLEVAKQYVSLEDPDGTVKADNPELLKRLEEVLRDPVKHEGLDRLTNSKSAGLTTQATGTCLPTQLEKLFPQNRMQTMTTSGAKGGQVNANLISVNLGQQVLEGRRVPVMVSGKSLPCFDPFDPSLRAGGYIVNRFLTGIRPQEYYFHHMAGREGLIDTAVKTASSGYLQRCIIKGMEGLTVSYDSTVRDADGSLVQLLYGEDGLDVAKQKYLTDFTFVARNMVSEASQLSIGSLDDAMVERKSEIMRQMKSAVKHAKAGDGKAKDPVTSQLNPARTLFATSEAFYEKMTQYIADNADGVIKEKSKTAGGGGGGVISKKDAELLFAAKYMRSMAEPGEAVGIVAGQSIGEPSTQMTLNTFHLAGHSAKNVTLGIPRLREILMTAAVKLKTPSTTLVLRDGVSDDAARAFAKQLSMLPMTDILDRAVVKERVGKGRGHALAKMYDISLHFFPAAEYSHMYAVTAQDVMAATETRFVSRLLALARKEIKKRLSDSSASTPVVGKSVGTVEMAATSGGPRRSGGSADDDGDDDDSDADADDDADADASAAKRKANRTEASTYGANDDDDDDIQRAADSDAESDDSEDGFGGRPAAGESDDDAGDNTASAAATANVSSRARRVLAQHENVTRFKCDERGGAWAEMTLEFDIDTPKLIMLNLVQDAVRASVVRQIPGVGACTYVANETVVDARTHASVTANVIHAAGINLRELRKHDAMVDVDRIATNDIAAVLSEYGVEAARNNIIQELNAVFGSHGISVDARHLNLIGDYMTRGGGFTPFNRIGLKGNVSPFTKMSFETTLGFLKEALMTGDWDDLKTPSARIVMGKLSKVGTGAFDVFTKVPTQVGGVEGL
ncbi:hypothetical protein TD95_004021 [Thielaviopsis punctulata]|uniref:DNA-directed RNA polymerase subunit n=1 Tax=Thielaviopsis punctulata TaxID=72032 RepID=A0A0F4Z6E5_9PEZI|nr:hypothetical protein TD95_004021 [Thielaviopsis punctulata]